MVYPTEDTSLLEKIGIYNNIPIESIQKRFDALLEDARKRSIKPNSFIELASCPETEEMDYSFLSDVESAYILRLKMKYHDITKLLSCK